VQLLAQVGARHRRERAGFIGRIAQLELRRRGDEAAHEFVGDAGGDDEALGGDAGLPALP
jgi:hypothetical protein